MTKNKNITPLKKSFKNIGEFSAKTDIRLNFRRCILVIFCCLLVILSFTKPLVSIHAQEIQPFNANSKNYNVKLQILNQNNKILAEFTAAIADNDSKRKMGLMHLDQLPQNHAMLFIFDESRVISMWMKNTRIPLDMIFLNHDNVIVDIKTDTSPYSLEVLSSHYPARRVLEINAGLSKKFGIEIGHQLTFTTQDK